MTEMKKLQRWLDKNGIKYLNNIDDINQIVIEKAIVNEKGQKDHKALAFACNWGTMGYLEGLIEMYDFQNEPTGFMTAKECIEEIKEFELI